MDLQHEERLTKVEERSKSNAHRLDEVEKRQNDLAELVSAVNVLAIQEKNLENDVKEIKSDVKSLKYKPAQRWDNLAEKILWAVVAAILAFVLSNIGL